MVSSFLDPVYPLTHWPNRNGLNHAELARRFLLAGSRFFQVRGKDLPDRTLLAQLNAIERECEHHQARFLVNDRCDLAWAARASGVHLGQTDMPVALARSLLGPSAVLGVSTHNEEQFLQMVEQPVDYVAVGPVFSTLTKQTDYPPVGLQRLAKLVARTKLPVVAIGGITLANVAQIWASGAASAAVVSDITDAEDPVARISEYFALAAKYKRD